MATDHFKPTSTRPSVAEQHGYVTPPAPGPVHYTPFNSAAYHPAGAYPSFYSYPPPPEGSIAEGGAGTPHPGYMMFAHAPPPGMVFAFTPPQTAPVPQQSQTVVGGTNRPKRKQVKMACTNCAAACKRCDEQRPCERCKKYGIIESCVDGQRKERKKGIKRGPYKRRNRSTEDGTSQFPEGAATESTEWSTSAASPPAGAIPPQFPNGEAFYPTIYYPPGPGPFLAATPLPPPQPQDGNDGSNSQVSGQPSPVSYYIHGAYPPPFPHYPTFLSAPPPPPHQSTSSSPPPSVLTTVDPAVTSTSINGEAKVLQVIAGPGTPSAVAAEASGKRTTRGEKIGGGGTANTKKGKRRTKGGAKEDGQIVTASNEKVAMVNEKAEPEPDVDVDAEGEAGDGDGEEGER